MFRRKEDDNLFATDNFDTLTAPVESATVINPQSATAGSTTSSFTPATATPAAASRPAQESRPAPQASFRPAAPISSDMTRNRLPEPKQQPTVTAAATTSASNAANKSGKRVLTVGNDILLKGEIATCDRLVIEGKVDATLNDVHTVEIAEGGSFKGAAQIEDAEISGLFEGDLIVRGCLIIRSTGKVRGKISFGEVEIERGGELTGEIKLAGTQQTGARPARNPQTAPAKQDDKVAA